MKKLSIIIMGFLIPLLGFSQLTTNTERMTIVEKLTGGIRVETAPDFLEKSSDYEDEKHGISDQKKGKVDENEAGVINNPSQDRGGIRNLFAGQKIFALVIGLFIITGLIGNFVAMFLVNRKSSEEELESKAIRVFNLDSLKLKKGFHFGKTHTWAFMDEEGQVRVGIDDFLQHVTGPVTGIKMKMPGETIKKGDQIFSIIQRGKRLNIYSPVSGVIKRQNETLDAESFLLNKSPYDEGWIYEVEPTNWMAEAQDLLMGQKYINWLKEEFARLKDFLASSISLKHNESAGLVLQEGGELRDGVLDDCGPEIWEEFQANFIENKE